MRQHARGRQKQRGGGGKGAVAGSGFRRGFPTRETTAAANAGVAPLPPPQVLRERGSAVGFLSVRRRLFVVGDRRTDEGATRSRGGRGGGRC